MRLDKKNNFFLYFWLICVEAPSENVVSMGRREGISF